MTHSPFKYPPYTIKELKCGYGIYTINNLVTGWRYIGKTAVNFQERWNLHQSALNKGKHNNNLLQSDWNRYGRDVFEFKVLEYLPRLYMGAYRKGEYEFLMDKEHFYVTAATCPLYNIKSVPPPRKK